MNILLWIVIVAVTIPTMILAVEVVASAAGRRRLRGRPIAGQRRPAVDVLVPAHDEEHSIAVTIASIQSQMRPGDRLTVIADNCQDGTAEIAERLSAHVVRRRDEERRGKGFAVQFGLEATKADAREVVVIVDADCVLAESCLDRLAARCGASGRPVQASYRMSAGAGASATMAIREFAWDLKNRIRPLGLASLGGPCQLQGTGMAFPRQALDAVEVGTAHIVEDLKLGLDLAKAGHPPLFEPAAAVESFFPPSELGMRRQHERWQRGSLSIVLTHALPCLYAALRRGDPRLLCLALDLLVPPIVMLGALSGVAVLLAGLYAAIVGEWLPLAVAIGSFMLLLSGLALGWRVAEMRGGRVSPIFIARFVTGRILAYPTALFSRSTAAWLRSERPSGPQAP